MRKVITVAVLAAVPLIVSMPAAQAMSGGLTDPVCFDPNGSAGGYGDRLLVEIGPVDDQDKLVPINDCPGPTGMLYPGQP